MPQPEKTSTPLCVVVITLNEEVNLPGCLRSLDGLRCNVFVVDSGSTDRTIEIANDYGAAVAEHEFQTYSAQRNWAQSHVPFAAPWVLHIDADERLTPPLVNEINAMLEDPPPDVNGFMLRKRTIFMGRWMRHGGHYPSYHVRLFRTNCGACEDRLYDQHFVVAGRLLRMQHDYLDILTSDLRTWTTRHARWAEFETRELLSHTASQQRIRADPHGNPIERKRWFRESLYGRAPLFWRAFFYWFYRYVVLRGFLDGTEGFVFHFLQGFWFRFLIDAMVYAQTQSDSRDSRRTHTTG